MKKLLTITAAALLTASPVAAHVAGNPAHTGADGRRFVHPEINALNCRKQFAYWQKYLDKNYASAHPNVKPSSFSTSWGRTKAEVVGTDAQNDFLHDCGKIKCQLKPYPPFGQGWHLLGQFGNSPCFDYFAKLLGRHGNRLTVAIDGRLRYGRGETTAEALRYARKYVIDCGRYEYYALDSWSPIMSETKTDYAARKFC